MIRIPNKEVACFNDPDCKVRLMRKYGHCAPFEGTNAEGERVILAIAPDSIILETYQSNGWIRKNYYDENGFPDGETFDGKWNKEEPHAEMVYILVQNWMEEGRLDTMPYKTKEAAVGAYRTLLEAMKNDDPDELEKDSHFLCWGVLDCRIQERMICDA